MDIATWKAAQAGELCPSWCTVDHREDNAEADSVEHHSDPLAVTLPQLPGGEEIQFVFSTYQGVEYEAPGPQGAKVDVTTMSGGQSDQLHDYATFDDQTALDQFVAQLEETARQLRSWRERLPERAV